MTETTTIQVTKEQAEQLADLKQYDDESYKSVIARLLDDSSATTDGQPAVDYERLGSLLDERLQAHLAEWEITVNMDQLDLDPVGMDENDVERIVRDEIEQHVHERARDMP